MKQMNLANLMRPHRMRDILGQPQTTEVLKAQLAKGKMSGNYIFAGKWGCGKTTAARIMAMAMTCERPDADGEPCCECDSCRAVIEYGQSMNVQEVNAASNRGIDQIRDIIERIQVPPSGGAGKRVVILDEAHMLTTEAANALLKILEEPPAYASFILCTTESDKLLPTIKSRCQCFRFEPITEEVMANTVREILTKENVKYEERVPGVVAHLANGSFRDCLSALEQCMDTVGQDGVLTVRLVCAVKGVASLDVAYNLIRCYLAGDMASVMSAIEEERRGSISAGAYADTVMDMAVCGMMEASGRHCENGYDLSFVRAEDMMYLLNLLTALSDIRGRINLFTDPYIQIMAAVVREGMKVPKRTIAAPTEDLKADYEQAMKAAFKDAEKKLEKTPEEVLEKAFEEPAQETAEAEEYGVPDDDGWVKMDPNDENAPFKDEPKISADELPFEEDDVPFEEDEIKKPVKPVHQETGEKKVKFDDFFGSKKPAPEQEDARQPEKLPTDTDGGEGSDEEDAGSSDDFDWGF